MDDLSKLSDPERLKAVRDSGLLDTPAEPDFDQLTRLAAQLLGTPSAFVTVITDDRQFIKSALEDGKHTDLAGASQPLDMSFCKHAVAANQPFLVENAREHEVVKDNKAAAAGVVSYAGIPLETQDGQAIGALCVVDSRPRHWSREDIENLRALARSAMKLIEDRTGTAGGGGEELPGNLLECVTLHLRAIDHYARLLKGSKSLDFNEEADVRRQVVRSFAGMKSAFEKATSGAELEGEESDLAQAVERYVEADQSRSEAARRFAAGEIELPVLESAIRRHMDAGDALRVTALNCGAEP